jgi:hypothetical protein
MKKTVAVRKEKRFAFGVGRIGAECRGADRLKPRLKVFKGGLAPLELFCILFNMFVFK